MSKGGKIIMVLMESMAGTGHKVIKLRPKLADKMEILRYDPWVQQTVVYRELKKIRTMRNIGKRY